MTHPMATHSPTADHNSVLAEFANARIHTEECQWHDEVPLPHATAFLPPTRARSTRRTAPQPTPHIARSVDFSLRRRAPLARSSVKAGRSDEASTWQVFSAALPPVATHLIISNRSACRLETRLTPALPTKVSALIDTNVATVYPASP
jgi:hypothetical protein